jgi:c-di-GMP-binding flagellar brake protein YcgR
MGFSQMNISKPGNFKLAKIGPIDLVTIKDILGCFYYLQLEDINLVIDRVERNYCVKSKIVNINKKSGKITIKTEKDVYFKPDERIRLSFVINSARYGFDSLVGSIQKEEEFIFDVPVSINYDDQRILPRASLPESINDNIELVIGIFNGVRIKGKIEDISLGGLSFTLESIENIRNKNEVDLKDVRIKIGDRFRNLKLEIEKEILKISGEICHIPNDDINTFGIMYDLNKVKNGNKLREFIRSFNPQRKIINFSSFYDNKK